MKYYVLAIAAILLLSAFFRLGYPGLAEFGMDEDSTACKILGFVDNHKLPPVLVKSRGIVTISIINVILYVTMIFVKNPCFIIAVFNGIPNTLAVILCFIFCYKFFDKKIAIVSTALFGFSSWAILYSKGLWGVNILQFFSILIFFFLALSLYKVKSRLIIFPIILLLLLPNLHLTSFSIFVSVFLIIFIYYRRLNLKYVFPVFCLLTVIFAALFVINKGWHGKMGLDVNITSGYFSLKALFTSMNLLAAGGWFHSYLGTSPIFPKVEIVQEIFIKTFFIFGAVFTLKKTLLDLKKRVFSSYVILGIWYFVFVILFGFINLTCFTHYFMVILPCIFIITAIGFFSIADYILNRNKFEQWELLILLFVFMLWSPYILILVIFAVLFLQKNISLTERIRKTIAYGLYFLMALLLLLQVCSIFQLFIDANRIGAVPGRAGLDIGAKVKVVEYVVNDAELKYKKEGVKSYYSIINDAWYNYLFDYLMPGKDRFLSKDKIIEGYHYMIIDDIKGNAVVEKTKNYLYHKRIGPKLIIVEKINEN